SRLPSWSKELHTVPSYLGIRDPRCRRLRGERRLSRTSVWASESDADAQTDVARICGTRTIGSRHVLRNVWETVAVSNHSRDLAVSRVLFIPFQKCGGTHGQMLVAAMGWNARGDGRARRAVTGVPGNPGRRPDARSALAG